MGLDMYAYAVSNKMVKPGELHVNINKALFEFRGLPFPNLQNPNSEELDSYYKLREQLVKEAEDEGIFNTEFYYWRKFNALHGWMADLYKSKGGTKDFNCVGIALTEEDLNQLEQDIDSLKPVKGFFFGSQEPLDKDAKDLIRKFVKDSREAMKDGMTIIYDSWW